ncbi:DNA polymerase delta catalytic subunit, partial [Aduncisulcus paluster]
KIMCRRCYREKASTDEYKKMGLAVGVGVLSIGVAGMIIKMIAIPMGFLYRPSFDRKSFNNDEDLVFQLIEGDSYNGPKTPNRCSEMIHYRKRYSDLPADSEHIIRFYGVTDKGHSICVHIHGFLPYLYIPAPPGISPADFPKMIEFLNRKLFNGTRDKGVKKIEEVYKRTIHGWYGEEKRRFLRITATFPKQIPGLRSHFETPGAALTDYISQQPNFAGSLESDILFLQRFLVDNNIVGCGWAKITKSKYFLRSEAQKHSTCQLEIDISCSDIYTLGTEGVYSKLAPMVILSFDIECISPKGGFPDPLEDDDKIITIASSVHVFGKEESMYSVKKTCHCLHDTDPVRDVNVISFDSERELLNSWAQFVLDADPDIITGYNTSGFDLHYVVTRAKKLKCDRGLYFSRLRDFEITSEKHKFQSKQMGTIHSFKTEIPGRVEIDMLSWFRRTFKLRSYTLNAVSQEFLGEQKEDLHYSLILPLFKQTSADRQRIAVYCVKDSELPFRLMMKLMTLVQQVEMSRVTGVMLSLLLTRGESIKVVTQVYRAAKDRNFLVPYRSSSDADGAADGGYEGAKVFDPIQGFYRKDQPICVLDFSSLYPSIIIAHNLCFTTLVSQATVRAKKLVEGVDYETTPEGFMFIKKEKQEGLLPRILEDLLGARKEAKKLMNAVPKDEPDAELKKQVYDARQKALKVSANSVYGVTGASVGSMSCMQISKSITAYG